MRLIFKVNESGKERTKKIAELYLPAIDGGISSFPTSDGGMCNLPASNPYLYATIPG